MATMEKLRKTSPYFLAAFAVLFVGFMVASDADISQLIKRRGNGSQNEPIAVVNGEKILYKDFEKRVTEAVDEARKKSKDKNAEEDIDYTQIRQQIFSEMVDEILLSQEAKKAGVSVSAEEILDVMVENPPEELRKPLTDSAGNFNRQVYNDLITNPDHYINYLGKDPSQIPAEDREKMVYEFRKQLINIEKKIQRQKLIEGVSGFVTASNLAFSPELVKEDFINKSNTANVDYIFLDPNEVPDNAVQVTEDEVRKYYDERKEFYVQKDMRSINYITIPLYPSKDDTARAELKIKKINDALSKDTTLEGRDRIFTYKINDFNGESFPWQLKKDIEPKTLDFLEKMKNREVIGPVKIAGKEYYFRLDEVQDGKNPQVKASHILIKYGKDKDSSKARALDILHKAKSGEDFADLATSNSEDPGTASQGGSLGWFGKGQMVPAFDSAAFAADSGDIVGLVETQFGYHIIKIDNKANREIKFSQIEVAVTLSTDTRNRLFREAFSFMKQIESGSDFVSLAKMLKYNPVTTPFYQKTQQFLGSQYLTDIAFQEKKGKVFDPLELKYHGIVVAQVADVRKAGNKSYEDMKAEIAGKIMFHKKIELLKSKADIIFTRASAFPSLKDFVKADSTYRLKSDSNFAFVTGAQRRGFDYVFASQILKLPDGKVNPPIKGDKGYYIAQVNSKRFIDVNTITDADIAKHKRDIITQSRQKAFMEWYQKLKEEADIKDNRSNFYRDY
jgi:peptidyl-prolyl cis-trans isomerase D